LLEKGFSRGNVDNTLFSKRKGKYILLVQVYVDDIIFGSTNDTICQEFSKLMQGEFEMSLMGELTFFLGLQIKQTRDDIFLSQTKYALELLKKFDMQDCKSISTPMESALSIDKDQSDIEVDGKRYRGMIGSLLYLTASRPHIMFSVCMCAIYQAYLKESHLKTVKDFSIYKWNHQFWIVYPKGSSCCLVGFSDSDFSGCKSDRKSTSGTCHLFRNFLISWHSKKQYSVAFSTAEAEYVVAGSCCCQILWIKQQLLDYDLKLGYVPIKCDNTSAFNLTKNLVLHSRTKHIEIQHHFLRDHVEKKDVTFEYVDTKNQLAHIFTKPLPSESFLKICRELGILDTSCIK